MTENQTQPARETAAGVCQRGHGSRCGPARCGRPTRWAVYGLVAVFAAGAGWLLIGGASPSHATTPAPTPAAGDTGVQAVWPGAPQGFIPPPLHPQDVQLETRQLGDGVYALLSNTAGVDNNGFVVGERGVLVIDAHISGAMARQIIDAVARVTDKPILYLVNTNYHGDHTFGNYAFPSSTTIIAHPQTLQRMKRFEHEKQFMLPTVNGDRSVYSDVELRLPDVVFDDYMRIDLGGRVVELYHFGAGNTPGDVVVYQPDAKVAWTGNLIVGAGTIPPMFEYGAATHLATVSRLRAALDIKTIVPGHGAMTDASILTRYVAYSSDLIGTVRGAIREGRTIDDVLAAHPLDERYLPPADSQMAPLIDFLKGLHRMNLVQTFGEESASR
ncbi:MAG: MBL fold metallo-hydrolase [Phycisphaeraceae bacterium]